MPRAAGVGREGEGEGDDEGVTFSSRSCTVAFSLSVPSRSRSSNARSWSAMNFSSATSLSLRACGGQFADASIRTAGARLRRMPRRGMYVGPRLFEL